MYRQVVSRLSSAGTSGSTAPEPDCPSDVAWREVAAGLWPDLKARQLLGHAALCDHCGPLLRAATREACEKPLQQKQAVWPESNSGFVAPPVRWWQVLAGLIPVCALLVVLGVMVGISLSSPTEISGAKYAEFAVRTHAQHVQGSLALELRSDSQEAVNEWLKQNAQFAAVFPISPQVPDEKRPYRVEGASLVPVGGKRAAFIAYQMDSRPASLMIAPYAVAVASGGLEAHFKKVTFHYRLIDGLKVVTWSQHGLTYALVSQEGTASQKSCMVCHSAMRDRDLSETPTPLSIERSSVRSYLQ